MLLTDILSVDVILERVDAYSLYSYYIGKELEIGRAYKSPFRDDDIPSFALFIWNNTLLFKDHGLGKSGNVFQFIVLLYGLDSINDALDIVNADFDLELEGGKPYEKSQEAAKIISEYKVKSKLIRILVTSVKRVTKEFIDYWLRYGITLSTLRYYYVTQVAIVHYVYESTTIYYTPKELCIAYPIFDKYKIYEPFNKKNKFKNNYPEDYIEGYLQLKYSTFCIITKATKEIIFFREHYDWDSVAGKSENTMITRQMMLILLKRYNKLYIWLDYDEAGQRAQKKYLEEYPFLIPIYFRKPQKDVTDVYFAAENKQEILQEIKQMIQ